VTEAVSKQTGGPDRRSLLRSGLLIGLGATVIGAASAGFTRVADAATAPNPQPNWWSCINCDGLFHSDSNGSPNGVCQSNISQNDGFRHEISGSSNYSVFNGQTTSSSGVQAGWRWCNLCDLLFWGPGNNSACPANIGAIVNGETQIGPHTIGSATVYDLFYGGSGAGVQDNWRWCNLCEGIFWGPRTYDGSCTGRLRNDGDSGGHSFGSATNYEMVFT
jgi:hypothetical protein